ACYPEAKLYGMNALASRSPTRPVPGEVSEEGRLTEGPAYGTPLTPVDEEAWTSDWPTYRKDNARSGASTDDIGAELKEQWAIDLKGRLTPPAIAGGTVYVAQTDQHTLYALNESDGKTKWTYTIGARIDSPPTIDSGRVVFGGADGFVYCLNADDGQLVWKYRAAPEDRRTMAFEQLESLWPVHGSALIRKYEVYVVAGRSLFLDGGLRLLRLDLATGKKLSETVMDDRNPETGNNLQEVLQILQMPVGLPDILSCDERQLYMRSQKFDFDGNRLKIGPNSGDFAGQASVQRGEGAHLFAPMGFLDDTWFHRSYWVYGQSFAGGHGGYYQAGRFAPSGRIMVQGGGYVFGYGRKPEYLRWTTTLEHQLFAAPPEPPEVDLSAESNAGAANVSAIQIKNAPSLNPKGKPLSVEAWINTTNPNGVVVARGGPADGYALTIAKGKPQFHVRAGNELKMIEGPKRIVGGWHHLVGVLHADKKMVLYVDGEHVADGEAPALIAADPKQAMEIGADLGSAVGEYESPGGFSGAIDEVRVYFTPLDDSAVSARFEKNEDPEADAVLVMPFDDGEARDYSPFRNNGSVSTAQVVDGKFGKAFRFTGQPRGRRGNNAQKKQSYVEHTWTSDIPIYVRAMVLANRRLFLVGPEDVINEEETFDQLSREDKSVEPLLAKQDEILNGHEGAWILSVDSDTGETSGKLKIDALPVWDGLAAANKKLFLTTLDGKIRCYAATN
ncbi:MAG: PQQ-binding-like beta-propeller repeat protein, partial [Planctomycetaceae bacterium]|nr:PQQ-binding-like beta-propeller repeat protein [Planctomycetaceae bacterium]